jgi:hypothetical protein
MKHVRYLHYFMWKVHLDNLSRIPEELHSPDVSYTCLRGGLDTTLQVSTERKQVW